MLFCHDLCASVWFVYLSYYLLVVVQLGQLVTAAIFFLSFLADGITTSVAGKLADSGKASDPRRNGRYIAGSLVAFASFACVFMAPTFES